MKPLIVELASKEAIYHYVNYRYWSIHLEESELDDLQAVLRVWVTENECHSFVIDASQYEPPCTTREQFWKQLLMHIHKNRFVVHHELG